MNELTGTPSSRQFDMPLTASTPLSPSSAAQGSGHGGGGKAPPPQFNLPDSYWVPRQDRSDFLHLKDAGATEAAARYLAACNDSKSTIAAMFEKLDADRENDPRSRTESLASRVNLMQFQPARVELSAETLAGLVVLKDLGGETPESMAGTAAATSSAATVTQQDAVVSGCCIPPSCTIL